MTAGLQWSHLAMEAALCVWEDLNERRHHFAQNNQALVKFWEEYGTVHVRATSPAIGSWIVEAFDFIERDSLDGSPYDWEIVPAFVGLVDWSRGGHKPVLMAPKAAAEIVARQLGGSLSRAARVAA